MAKTSTSGYTEDWLPVKAIQNNKDKVTVKVTDIDDQGRINLTAKNLNDETK